MIEPDTGLFAEGKLTRASGAGNHEAVIGLELLDGEQDAEGELDVLGDSAYGTGDALHEGGHTAIIKPAPLRPSVAGGFTTDDFTADEGAARGHRAAGDFLAQV